MKFDDDTLTPPAFPMGTRIIFFQRKNFLLPRPEVPALQETNPSGLRDVPYGKAGGIYC